jgi:hypothetical protein
LVPKKTLQILGKWKSQMDIVFLICWDLTFLRMVGYLVVKHCTEKKGLMELNEMLLFTGSAVGENLLSIEKGQSGCQPEMRSTL